MSKKYLYYFSEGNDAFGGDKVTMKNTLGGKGAGLAEMTAAGMPVPQGFTITTDACTQYYADGRQINDEITADIFEHLKGLEEITGKKFGDNTNPLLVSVRSGARQSMPGMMDTILNLGLNDEAVEGLAKKTGNARFAYDCYRRFVQMFADVVMMVPKSLFEVEIDKMKEAKGVKNDVDLTADDLKELVGTFKKIYEENEGRPFPQDPRDQLIEAVKAVFRSWDNPRANVYRKMNEIPYEWGTAVNVQQMAFGNSGDRSGTGVAFTRDPATGAKKLMGEYLINAQGEDVVAGVRTPLQVFLPIDGRLHGAAFPCGTHYVVTGRSTSLPGTGRCFPHDLTDAVRVHPAGTHPVFYVLSCHDISSWTMTTFYRRAGSPGCPSSSQGR